MGRDLEVIRSRANSGLKRIRAALTGRGDGELVLEGERLVRDAIGAGHRLLSVHVSEEHVDLLERLLPECEEAHVVEAGLLAQVSGLKTPPGVIALAPPPAPRDLGDLILAEDALVLVSAGVSDPGNLGALARSAEAAGAAALITLGGASPWSARALRGSMGSLLRLPVVLVGEVSSLTEFLSAALFRQVLATTRGGQQPASFDWSGRIAIWIGSETGELPELDPSLQRVTIPTSGAVDSLNVTVAASLLMFAAGRTGKAKG